MRLQDKVCIITGGGKGIGKAIGMAFAKEGAKVVLADIDEAIAIAAAEEISTATGRPTLAVRIDVSSKDENTAMVERAVEVFGQIDVLVANAGIVRKARPIEDITPEDWNHVLGIDLLGKIYGAQAVIPYFKKQNAGNIVLMASVSGEVGGVAAEATYAIAKAGVICLAKVLAKQLAPYNVTANAIAPGTIQTDMTIALDYAPTVKASIPLNRYGEVADIAAAATYLASSDAKYVTGTTLDVNGGMYMK